jgi:hypothetical protein
MIFTHPYLFNAIVVFFIAFTSGWVVFVISSRKIMKIKKRMKDLEREKTQAQQQINAIENQLNKQPSYTSNSAPVIDLRSAIKINKTN